MLAPKLAAWHDPTECGSCSLSKLPTIDHTAAIALDYCNDYRRSITTETLPRSS